MTLTHSFGSIRLRSYTAWRQRSSARESSSSPVRKPVFTSGQACLRFSTPTKLSCSTASGSGKVTFLPGSHYRSDGSTHTVTSLVSGEQVQVNVRRRVVDATYLSPSVPATSPPPFGVACGVRLATINDIAPLTEATSTYVIVGSGKTATDAIVWLLGNGVDPDQCVWVRPRDPWMLNRAVVQLDPAVFLGTAADILSAAADAATVDDLFVRLEAGDRRRRPDCALCSLRPPTRQWSLSGERIGSGCRPSELVSVLWSRPGRLCRGDTRR